MENKIFVDDVYEYDYVEEDDNCKLLFSNGSQWTFPNTVALEVKDTGNELIIYDKENKLVVLDYAMAEYLTIVLKIMNKNTKYELITETTRL